jgi:hypothetical protein
MLKKLALAGAMALALSMMAWAATVPIPSHLNAAGGKEDSTGVVCLNSVTGDPEACGGGGGGGAVTVADGADVTQGAKADAKSTATDTTPISVMSVLKQISASIQSNAASVSGTLATAGNVASGAADSGNPVKVGAKYNSTLPTLTDGQRSDLQVGTRGSLSVTLWGPNSLTAVQANTPSNGLASQAGLSTASQTQVFNGSTWDNAFTCTSQFSATVTAAATTQLVALSGSTNIRVCSYQVGIATTGTFKFVSGTGSNCGTGTADLTPATNLTAGNVVAVSAGNNSIFRAGASNALCLAAVTGNVQVFVSYAQF